MILRNDPIDAYHARIRNDPRTYSHTTIRHGATKGWRSLDMLCKGEIAIEDNDRFAFGRAFETRLADGRDAYLRAVALRPPGIDLRTKDGKAWAAESAGKLILTADDDRMIEDMVAAIMEIPEARAIVETFERDLTLDVRVVDDAGDWTYNAECGLVPGSFGLQVHPDYMLIRDGQAITVNLKTCADITKLTSGRGIADFGYHTSMGLERVIARANGVEINQCFDLAVEKSYPSRAALIELSPMFVDLGEFTVTRWIDELRQCHETGVWPRMNQTQFVAEPPPWLTKER